MIMKVLMLWIALLSRLMSVEEFTYTELKGIFAEKKNCEELLR